MRSQNRVLTALLRKYGYNFKSDPPNYYSSNQLTNNTIYPALKKSVKIKVEEFSDVNIIANKKEVLYKFGEKEISFIIKKFHLTLNIKPHWLH